MRVELYNGGFAEVDDEDSELVSKYGWRRASGPTLSTEYAVALGNPWLSMHVLLLDPPVGMVVDHIDNNGLNNQRSNIRVTTYSGNQHRKPSKGYHYEAARGKWKVTIMINGKSRFLGRYDTEEEAAKVAHAAKQDVLSSIFGDE